MIRAKILLSIPVDAADAWLAIGGLILADVAGEVFSAGVDLLVVEGLLPLLLDWAFPVGLVTR